MCVTVRSSASTAGAMRIRRRARRTTKVRCSIRRRRIISAHPSKGGSSMSKNIVVCLDGTNDTYVPGGVNTNVGRIFEASINDARQVKFYSDGVGVGGHA